MKQNVTANLAYALMDAITAVLLYLVFPIVPLYVLPALLALVMVSSALGKHGVSTAVLITYVVLTFITALGHASLLVVPLLLITYLITEAGVINDIALVSWALLFTRLYWLSIPLSIAPSIKGYGVRSTAIFSLLLMLYVIGAAYLGITWVPISIIHVMNLDITRGFESLLLSASGSFLTVLSELTNPTLYLVLAVTMVAPPLMGRYLPRLLINHPMNACISHVITDIPPQLIVASLLYVPLIIGSWNYHVPYLLAVGALSIGLGTYTVDVLRSGLRSRSSHASRTGESPIVIPITDPLMITEYNQWARKLPKDYLDLANTVVNTLSKAGIAVLRTSMPRDRVEVIAKALFGLTRSKGFIIKGEVNELTDDVDWFLKTHGNALLVLIPNEISKDVLVRLVDYHKRTGLYALIVGGGAVDRLRRYGVEVIDYNVGAQGDVREVQALPKYVEEVGVGQGIEVEETANAHKVSTTSPNEATANNMSAIGNVRAENSIGPAQAVEQVSRRANEVGGGLASNRGIAMEGKGSVVPGSLTRKEGGKVRIRPRARDRGVNATVEVQLDPVELISVNTRSKLIDYVDSSIRLRDMMSNLGLKYMTSILVIGPPRSGKTALINYVAKHLGVAIVNYRDPSISTIDNAVIHVPNLREAINEDPNYVLKLLSIARAKHLVVVFESSDPWSIDPSFIKRNIDAVVPVLPIHDECIDKILGEKLRVGDRDREVIRSIIKSCPAIEAIDRVRNYLTSRDTASAVCEDSFRKYQDFAQSLVLK